MELPHSNLGLEQPVDVHHTAKPLLQLKAQPTAEQAPSTPGRPTLSSETCSILPLDCRMNLLYCCKLRPVLTSWCCPLPFLSSWMPLAAGLLRMAPLCQSSAVGSGLLWPQLLIPHLARCCPAGRPCLAPPATGWTPSCGSTPCPTCATVTGWPSPAWARTPLQAPVTSTASLSPLRLSFMSAQVGYSACGCQPLGC